MEVMPHLHHCGSYHKSDPMEDDTMTSIKNMFTKQLEQFLQECLCEGIVRAKSLGADAFKGEQHSRAEVNGLLNQRWYKGCVDVPYVYVTAIRYDEEHYQYKASMSLDYLDHGWLIEQLNIYHIELVYSDNCDGQSYAASLTSKSRRYDNGRRSMHQSKSVNWMMESIEDFDLSTMIASL